MSVSMEGMGKGIEPSIVWGEVMAGKMSPVVDEEKGKERET